MSRGAMTMRATVSRNATTAANDWGTPGVPVFEVVATDVPCRAWSKVRREVRDSGKEAVIEDLRAVIPSTVNVAEDDRLDVTDRLGASVFGGPVAVETITRRVRSPSSSAASGHLELMLVRHTGAG